MLVTQSVCCDVFDGDVWLGKYCAKIFAIGIFLRILTGIDTWYRLCQEDGIEDRLKTWSPRRCLGQPARLAPGSRQNAASPMRAGRG